MYGKIYEQTFTGSMVGSGAVQFATWAYVIAYTKPDHRVELNPVVLSHLIGCEEVEVQKAIDGFCDPDPRSRCKLNEGKKLIKEGEFLYFVVNHGKFRGIRDDDGRREYMRNYMRERRKGVLTVKSKQCEPPLAQAEAEAISSTETPLTPLKGAVKEKFSEWMNHRRKMGGKVKDWNLMFEKQVKFLLPFTETEQVEILEQSMRNGWQGLFPPKRAGNSQFEKPKQRAPSYPKLPPRIDQSDEERDKAAAIAKEEAEKFRQKFSA